MFAHRELVGQPMTNRAMLLPACAGLTLYKHTEVRGCYASTDACERVFTRQKPNKVAWPWGDRRRPMQAPFSPFVFFDFPALAVAKLPMRETARVRPRSPVIAYNC